MSKEIEYPVYRKGKWHSYKVISENEAIEVYNGIPMNDFRTQKTISKLAYLMNIEDCLESEFLEAYYEVRRKLDEICLIQIDK